MLAPYLLRHRRMSVIGELTLNRRLFLFKPHFIIWPVSSVTKNGGNLSRLINHLIEVLPAYYREVSVRGLTEYVIVFIYTIQNVALLLDDSYNHNCV